MRGLLVPEQSEDFTADPVELFFDLAFVFAFSQLVAYLVHHPNWEGVGNALLIFLLLWLPWTQFTWSANSVPGNQRSVRAVFLVATAASVPMAAAVSTALDQNGPLFAIPLAVIHLMAMSLLVFGLDSSSKEFTSSVRYALPNVAAMIVLLVGGFLDDGARVVAWSLSIVIIIVATVRAGNGDWILRSGHFAERHALIIIVALGEVIVALGNAVVGPLNEGEGFEATAVVALAATGAAAGLLWWSYFDRVQPAFEHRTEEATGVQRGRLARDVYTYSHAPVVAGIILTAAALEEATLHPADELSLAFRMMLLGGATLFLGGIGAGVFRAFRAIAKERLAALGVLAILMFAAPNADGVVLLVAFDVIVMAMLVLEHVRIEGRPTDHDDASDLGASSDMDAPIGAVDRSAVDD